MSQPSDVAPSFVVDYMLGRLVTWLRLLGCDTVYANKMDDAAIARLAQEEGRTLLTRDRELARRKNIQTVLVVSDQVDAQLAQVVEECGLGIDRWPARCSVCNVPLDSLPRQEAEGRVPPYVFRTQRHFYACPGCGHVYWKGTHWRGMRRRLAALLGGQSAGSE